MRTGVKQGHGRNGSRVAFTLIELLVVVAIIALLISILLPALGRARESAKQTLCAANMRSVGQAFSMYGDQYQGKWPAAVDSMETQNRWPVPFHLARIITAELNRYDDNGVLARPGGASVFLCPSELASRDIPDWRGTGRTVDRVEVGGSYSYNAEVHRTADETKIQYGGTTEPTVYRPINQCKRPAEVFALMEMFQPIAKVGDPGWRYDRDTFYKGYRKNDGSPFPQTPYSDYEKRMGARHKGNMNVLAMDTHVEGTKPERVSYNQISWTRWDDPDALPPGGQ